MQYYAYLRVSTIKQDVARQKQAIEEYKKEKNIEILDENYYIDYYSGKTFDRENYQKMLSVMNKGDYLIVKEVDRLGRNWDLIKKEWTNLQDKGINIIIIDIPILSNALPNETEMLTGLTGRLIKEQMLTLMCYSAQLERDKISQRTKEALAEKKINGTKSGRPIGRPKSDRNNEENLIKALELLSNGYTQSEASFKSGFPECSLKLKLKELYKEYESKDYKLILKNIKEI